MSKEVLFAAIDDAASAAEWDALLDALEHDPALKTEWSRAWAARDAREGVQIKAAPDFCGSVMAAIASEPQAGNVVPLPSRRASRVPSLNWQTLVPLSAAAGVVAAVLLVGGVTPQTPPAASLASAESSAALPDAAKAAILDAYLMEHSNSLAERSMGSTLANARFAVRSANFRPDSP